ncbi:MAG TPA: acyl carrier protein [Thermoanaerobaculia bacterium]|nr:acyl carrier protein [Thermoanaerobaculia bacterium]
MNDTEILELITAELSRLSDRDTGPITPDTRLREELGLNSLDAVDLALKLEDELDIELPDEELATFETVGDVARSVRGRLDGRVAAEPAAEP